jgi:hypothetical protein
LCPFERSGQHDSECGAFARAALNIDRPTALLDDRYAREEAERGSYTVVTGAEGRREQMLQCIDRNAHSRVTECSKNCPFISADLNPHFASRVDCLHGTAEKDQEHVPESVA